ncbi:MAG: aminotransferase class I/II-fold pyridoxal phosphate-dependent enzyme [Clostridiales Family XIII bacterium]|jgi:aminotransferase|nr:aminotransferase class I/II-fold pyridoxal phosphate-dependent enzyme [Clostridiales Family XIII bacterium]
MPETSIKLEGFTESVIRMMTRVANEYGAINLSQGFPDFDPPPAILDALAKAAYEGPHQYEVTWGSQLFREKLAAKQTRLMGIEIDPDKNIVVTCGSTEAMMTAMLTVCNPGDKVVVFSPFYENYGADAILSGADPVFVPLVPPTFTFDPAVLEAAIAGGACGDHAGALTDKAGAKALILCNPSNPSGKVFTKEELETIAALAIKYDLFVITDEVYEHIVYKPYKHIYIASLPGMAERTISCSSLSKTYSITGWRLGYVIASEAVISGAKKVHDFLTVGAPAPLQKAAVTGLEFGDDYYESLLDEYTRKKNLFLGGLDEAGLTYYEPQGAYYVLVDIENINPFETDGEYCLWLAKNVGVAAVPGSSFFKEDVNRYIRFHFAKKDETLRAAIERLSVLKNEKYSSTSFK